MSHRPQSEPPAHSQWKTLRALERVVTVGTWALCGILVWAGVRAWASGAGITMMVIALVVCAVAALSLPHVLHLIFKQVMSGNDDLDDEWRRYDRRG